MADLSNDIRLAVDSGKALLGANRALQSIADHKAKMVIVASKNKEGRLGDMEHLTKLSDIRIQEFEGTPMELGIVCGKPFSVSVISIIDPGHSRILEETY